MKHLTVVWLVAVCLLPASVLAQEVRYVTEDAVGVFTHQTLNGTLVGYRSNGQPYVSKNGVVTDIGPLGSRTLVVSESGGYAYVSPSGGYVIVDAKGVAVSGTNPLPEGVLDLNDINNVGVAVGTVSIPNRQRPVAIHVVVITASGATVLNTGGATFSKSPLVNDAGTIVVNHRAPKASLWNVGIYKVSASQNVRAFMSRRLTSPYPSFSSYALPPIAPSSGDQAWAFGLTETDIILYNRWDGPMPPAVGFWKVGGGEALALEAFDGVSVNGTGMVLGRSQYDSQWYVWQSGTFRKVVLQNGHSIWLAGELANDGSFLYFTKDGVTHRAVPQ